jgi:hypothetical protein
LITSSRIAPLPNNWALPFAFFFSEARRRYIPFRMPSRTSGPCGIGGWSYCSFITVM